jgi:aspartate/methionine/tyrosine aminotransferase
MENAVTPQRVEDALIAAHGAIPGELAQHLRAGNEGYLRFSVTGPPPQVREAARRLRKYFDRQCLPTATSASSNVGRMS